MSPQDYADPIDDNFVTATAGLNDHFAKNPHVASMVQALSSACLDISMITLFSVGALYRSSTRPFLSLFLFMSFRFVGQAMATIPCAPGFLWPRGEINGMPIPTLFVDYHPANDMFFSGHCGTVIIAGLEFMAMDHFVVGMLHLCVVLPLVSIMVVSFRAHRGIDVVAAVFAAIAAVQMAQKLADPIDHMLLELKHKNDKRRNSNSNKHKKKGKEKDQ